MKLLQSLALALLDPSENHQRFVEHCKALLRRALRLAPLHENPDRFPPAAVALCVCSHLCQMSLDTVYAAYRSSVAETSSTEKAPLSKECLSTVHREGWTAAAREMGLETENNGFSKKRKRGLFDGYFFFFVPSLFFSERCAHLLLTRVQEKGAKGKVCAKGEQGYRDIREQLNQEQDLALATHVCADLSLIKKYSSVYQLDAIPPKWIHDCLRDLRIKDMNLYRAPLEKNRLPSGESICSTPKRQKYLGKRVQISTELRTTTSDLERVMLPELPELTGGQARAKVFCRQGAKTLSPVRIPRSMEERSNLSGRETKSGEPERVSNWACERRTTISGSDFPLNEKICELLGIIKESYDAKKDTFRAIGYQRAISRISKLDYELSTVDEVRALSTGKGIGERIERKIIEIVKTGRLQQAEAVLENADNKAVRELCDVWGIGPAKALNLIAHGIRSVADLRAKDRELDSILDKNQKIGLKHYEDLLLRIPRERVAELERFVTMIAKSVDQGLYVKVAGSYLRGKKDCGDVDIIVCGTREQLQYGFRKVISVMKKKGVLTDDLIDGDNKYFGIFHFPGRPHGRIDLFAVPREEYPFALLTYTGSAIFNR